MHKQGGKKEGRKGILTIKVVSLQGFTACQIAQQNSTDLSFGSSYPIRCKQDGSYEEVQCSGSNGYCWCVDKNGVKLNGTETRGALKCPAFGKSGTLIAYKMALHLGDAVFYHFVASVL